MVREKEESFQTALRFPRAWAERLEVLGKRLSPVVPLPMSAVLRAALERGISALEAEAGIAAPDAEGGATGPEGATPGSGNQKGEPKPARKPASRTK